jgi:hypothetical protein
MTIAVTSGLRTNLTVTTARHDPDIDSDPGPAVRVNPNRRQNAELKAALGTLGALGGTGAIIAGAVGLAKLAPGAPRGGMLGLTIAGGVFAAIAATTAIVGFNQMSNPGPGYRWDPDLGEYGPRPGTVEWDVDSGDWVPAGPTSGEPD